MNIDKIQGTLGTKTNNAIRNMSYVVGAIKSGN